MNEDRTPPNPAAPRASDLQVQFEHVALALQQLRHTHDNLQEMESRLADMTRDCAGILDRWAKNDEKHASAVIELHSRLSEWNDLERKLLNESAARVHQFERSLQHEWTALRQKHEEPMQRLDEQARRITETCLTAIESALKGFDRAEARLAAVEQNVSQQMNDLSREVREAVAELRQGAPQLGPRRPWSLDNVVRLHSELRAEADDTGDLAVAGAAAGSGGAGMAVARAVAPAPRRDVLQDDAPHRSFMADPVSTPEQPRDTGLQRRRTALLGAGALVLAVLVFAGWQRLETRFDETSQRAAAAERSVLQTRDVARQAISAVEQAADRRIQTAQRAADTAQLLTGILAAPDLRRFDLLPAAPGITGIGRVLWSRSHGVTLSASRLPPLPQGMTYQLWLRTPTVASSAGTLTPDADGRASLSSALPATLPRPIVGASVTVERLGGAPNPTGEAVLITPPPAPPAPPPPPR
jgi:hypothetical protein